MRKLKAVSSKHSAASSRARSSAQRVEPMPAERAEIIEWLKKVRFPGKLIGGVDERAVWKRIEELDALYAKALQAERLRYNALLEEFRRSAAQPDEIPEEARPAKGGDPGG